MPFKDLEERRRYDRERKRRLRSEPAAVSLVFDAPERLRLAEDVEVILAYAITLAVSDTKARGVERARTLGYLSSIALRLIEAHELQSRLEVIEEALGLTRHDARRAG